uniref:Cyclin-dependent kinase 2 homolog n=1 Tax=Chromera velia CCMP2878 TaxID=1169474 RepID=A0A0G4G3D0_9ALVE|mmetsp:Transcript_44294/g.87430  ORF Transcript_44294/g.87430 Transcript_44294/m.87430 type:complete len:528 (+) Transcript_44294:291-1874(+)|eukprot:Cvel_19962.t1-p1 / transcript=Cvel_19962.t1 / gene=Cvel_19962 / organism=Chromera_velia_CCMP2878 / gene_product=Cyclin-dependent kinase G-2, putative / transcript_product=Cyclin-dependent kinase G-2, putative / location=Cvel_scaffold1757:27471-35529(-) / protein_length=527 / sequence_SO=supercontig / SO=protein_coding / is_pseudo=false
MGTPLDEDLDFVPHDDQPMLTPLHQGGAAGGGDGGTQTAGDDEEMGGDVPPPGSASLGPRRARDICPSPAPSVGGLGLSAAGVTGAAEGEAHNPLLHGCRAVKQVFDITHKISEGTYGVVYSATDKVTGERVALKQFRVYPSHTENGFPLTSLREIGMLLMLRHENVVKVKEVCVGEKEDYSVWLVMEYLEHELKDLLSSHQLAFRPANVKCLMHQLLTGVQFMHSKWMVHRDLKTTNLLYSNHGELKVCDFGLARLFGEPIRPMTVPVVTLWYRAPEVLADIDPQALQSEVRRPYPRFPEAYTQAIDMWSVGCIFAELFLGTPLFAAQNWKKGDPVDNEMDMLNRIFKLTGVPDESSWPAFWNSFLVKTLKKNLGEDGLPWKKKNNRPTWREKFPAPPVVGIFAEDSLKMTEKALDLLKKLLTLNPADRISATEALNHGYFRESPAMTERKNMPTFSDSNATARSRKDRQKSVDAKQQEERERYHMGMGRYDSAGGMGVGVNAAGYLAMLNQQDRQRSKAAGAEPS